MIRGLAGCFFFFAAAPAIWCQTLIAGQQAQMAKILAMDQNEVGRLLNSEPPAFCTVVPAVSATMLVSDDNTWNWAKMPLEQRIKFEQVYAAGLRKLQLCLNDSIQKNDEQGIESGFFALALLEARYLDLRASLIGDAAVRIEQLSGAVNQMQNLFLALNQSQRQQKQGRFAQALGGALNGLGNWAQYQQQLNLYRPYSVTVNANQPRPALDVFGMMKNVQNDLNKASHPLGSPVNCTSRTLLDGTVRTVCQ